jgi:FKBP-type peptidyl-prolyl cis-trans isomerase FklB
MRFVLSILSGVFLLAGQIWAAEETAFKTYKEKVSYVIGVDIGKGMKDQSLDIDSDVLVKGLKDGITGAGKAMTDEEMRQVLTAFQKDMAEKYAQKMKVVGEKNKKEGEAFLEANKKKEGVKTLPSGLQYKVIREGNGPTPKAKDTVTANYRGTLIDGTEFDSSYKHKMRARFVVKDVMPGWTEPLQLMKVGSTWQIFVPSRLAYGEQGLGNVVGPNATVIYEMELISASPGK